MVANRGIDQSLGQRRPRGRAAVPHDEHECDYCNAAATASCRWCDAPICGDCSHRCADCGRPACSGCSESCSGCGDETCDDCISHCGHCCDGSRRWCASCVDRCERCSGEAHPCCSQPCEQCRSLVCGGCYSACSGCSQPVCDECSRCEDCGLGACCAESLCRHCGRCADECCDCGRSLWNYGASPNGPLGDGPWVGLELEFGWGAADRAMLLDEWVGDPSDVAMLKRDGSVEAGFELCARAVPIRDAVAADGHAARLIRRVRAILDEGAEPYEACGLHVHVSRDAVGPRAAYVAARAIGQSADQDIKIVFGRLTTRWARPQSPEQARHVWRQAGGRYVAINGQPGRTIEVRAWAPETAYGPWSSDVATWSLAAMQGSAALFRWAREADERMRLVDFIAWCVEQSADSIGAAWHKHAKAIAESMADAPFDAETAAEPEPRQGNPAPAVRPQPAPERARQDVELSALRIVELVSRTVGAVSRDRRVPALRSALGEWCGPWPTFCENLPLSALGFLMLVEAGLDDGTGDTDQAADRTARMLVASRRSTWLPSPGSRGAAQALIARAYGRVGTCRWCDGLPLESAADVRGLCGAHFVRRFGVIAEVAVKALRMLAREAEDSTLHAGCASIARTLASHESVGVSAMLAPEHGIAEWLLGDVELRSCVRCGAVELDRRAGQPCHACRERSTFVSVPRVGHGVACATWIVEMWRGEATFDALRANVASNDRGFRRVVGIVIAADASRLRRAGVGASGWLDILRQGLNGGASTGAGWPAIRQAAFVAARLRLGNEPLRLDADGLIDQVANRSVAQLRERWPHVVAIAERLEEAAR